MNIKAVTHRLNFYAKWHDEMPMGERIGWLGAWVKARIGLLTEALVQLQEQELNQNK